MIGQNINVDRFRNGDLIPQAITNQEWIDYGVNGTPCWCYYNNDPLNGDVYGKIYNWHAVNDVRGICPEGYHVPTKSEMELYSEEFRDLVKGGLRNYLGDFYYLGDFGHWWSSTDAGYDIAWSTYIHYYENYVGVFENYKLYGFSVCTIVD
jgi:hypothetical protein